MDQCVHLGCTVKNGVVLPEAGEVEAGHEWLVPEIATVAT